MRVARDLDAPAAIPRETLNKLALMEVCLKHGSMKFKAGLEDALRPGVLRELGEGGSVSASAVRAAATRVSELLEDAEKLRAARDEAQRLRSRLRELPLGRPDVRYGSGSSEDRRSAGYDRPSEPGLRKKLGLTEASPAGAQPPAAAVDLLGTFEAGPAPPRQLKSLPPPPKKGQGARAAESPLLGLSAASENGIAPPPPVFDLLDL